MPDFKNGDKVALRATPDVLHGTLTVVNSACWTNDDQARYLNGRWTAVAESPKDYIPYVEPGQKKFWMPIKLQANGQYDLTLEKAMEVAQRQSEKTGDTYIVVEAVAKIERPLPPITVTKFV